MLQAFAGIIVTLNLPVAPALPATMAMSHQTAAPVHLTKQRSTKKSAVSMLALQSVTQ